LLGLKQLYGRKKTISKGTFDDPLGYDNDDYEFIPNGKY